MFAKWIFPYLTAVVVAHAAAGDTEKLYSLVRAGDLSGLKALLDGGVSPNARDSREITPLMYAAEVGSVAEMRILIEHHAAVNAQNGIRLHWFLMWSAPDAQKVRLLLGAWCRRESWSPRAVKQLC